MVFHTKAVEVYSSAFQTLENYDLDRDLQVGLTSVGCLCICGFLSGLLCCRAISNTWSGCHPYRGIFLWLPGMSSALLSHRRTAAY